MPIRHPLGSRRRWLASFVLLAAFFLAVNLILWAIFRGRSFDLVFHNFYWLVLGWVILLWVGLDSKRSVNKNWRIPWLSDLDTKLAYGSVEEDGIYFQKWFRRSFVRWKGIERVEFWPDCGGRIDLHLYNRWSPVVFMPEGEEREAVDCISKKLGEAWPGHSTFVISIETPASKDAGIVYKFLSGIGLGRHAASMALALFFGYCYSMILAGSPWGYFRQSAILLGVCLILAVAGTLFRKLWSNIKKRQAGLNEETTKQLNG